MFKIKRYQFTLITISFFLIAVLIQSSMLINWDVAWDIAVAKRILAGGTYTHDFFDLNPPIALYHYIPTVLLQLLFSINSAHLASCIYVFLVSVGSLSLCYYLIQKIFNPKHKTLAYLFFFVITIAYLIFPHFDFAEREHLLLIFSLPYILTLVCRIENEYISTPIAITVGLLAGLVFGMKPYFLIVPFFLEGYFILQQRRFLAFFRIETGMIFLALVVNVFVTVLMYPDYLSTVVPVASRFYYNAIKDSWGQVLFTQSVLFCLLALSCGFFQYKKNSYRNLNAILLIALVSFIIIYCLQHTAWRYHILPAFSIAMLMMVLSCNFFIASFSKGNLIFKLATAALVASSLIFQWLIFSIVSFQQIRKDNRNSLNFLKKKTV